MIEAHLPLQLGWRVFAHFQGTLTNLIASRDWASIRRDTMQASRIAGLRRATDWRWQRASCLRRMIC